jgi:large subunit ribosomal protein L18
MADTVAKQSRRKRAHKRIRNRVSGTAERPRLAVFKSSRYVYAQLIDDLTGSTLAQASSTEAAVASGLPGGSASKVAARAVGEAIAERAKARGIEQCVFDRGGYRYHGKVKELAEAARAKGLEF